MFSAIPMGATMKKVVSEGKTLLKRLNFFKKDQILLIFLKKD
jgi:hypothetical protein